MDRLTNLETFIGVLELGSFSAYARHRGISQPAVSQQIAALEAHYGQTLMHRSTTGASPTRAGKIVAHHARAVRDQHRLLSSELAALGQEATGEFRITTSQFLGHSLVGQDIQALCTAHPELKLILKVEDRVVDVVAEGYDMALRTGHIGDGGGIGRKIAELQSYLVASPEYLDRVGRPQSPDDLRDLAHIKYSEEVRHDTVTLTDGAQTHVVAVKTGMVVDTPLLFQSALMRGFGVGRVPAVLSAALLKSGEVERVLPNYDVPPKSVYLVYPHRDAMTQTARLVAEAIYGALHRFDYVTLLPAYQPSNAA